MKTILAVAAIVVLACIQVCYGEARDYETCGGKPMKLEPAHKEKLDKCLTDAGAKNLKDVKEEKCACFAKCKLTACGELDADGKPNKQKILDHINKVYPDELKQKVHAKTTECLDIHFMTKDAKDYKDASCSGYASLGKCIKQARKEVCG